MQNRKSKLIFPCFQPPLWTTCRRRQTSMLRWNIFWSTIQVNGISWSRAEQPNRRLRLSFISWPNNEDFKLFKAVANTTEQTLKSQSKIINTGVSAHLTETNVQRYCKQSQGKQCLSLSERKFYISKWKHQVPCAVLLCWLSLCAFDLDDITRFVYFIYAQRLHMLLFFLFPVALDSCWIC